MVQTLSCRYKDYYTAQPTNNKHTKCSNPGPQTAAGQWQGDIMFCGAASSLARSKYGATKEAMMEAVLTAKTHGFFQILILSNSKGLVQVLNSAKSSSWQETPFYAAKWIKL